MIDYEKLKLAVELTQKLKIPFRLEYQAGDFKGTYSFYHKIDDLISELQDLIAKQPKTKDAWYLLEDEICKTVVADSAGYQYINGTDIKAIGRTMYDSKDELINAQIEYWESQRDSEECEHQDDGNCYMTQPAQTRCIKCGEFYR